jgi:hypothetical protein
LDATICILFVTHAVRSPLFVSFADCSPLSITSLGLLLGSIVDFSVLAARGDGGWVLVMDVFVVFAIG